MSTFSLNISELHARYKDKSTSPRKLILSLREQAIEQSDFNAWIYLLSEDELEPYFERLERVQEHENPERPLYGVPFAIKDNIDLAQVPTTAACPDFSYTPEKSAFVVQQLIQAGAIPLGKTNMDQFATGLVGTRSPFGQGKNAFNPDYCSGGSSSGSAISTALGQVSFALGTDTAGSGRVPAAFNNLIGHKPTKGVFGSSGLVPACRTLDCISVFTLTAKDAATVFGVAAQYDQNDDYARRNSYRNIPRYFSGSAPKTFRFGIPSTLDFQGNKECEQLFLKAKSQLIQLGGEAVEFNFEPFIEAARLLYEGPWVAERWLATMSDFFQTETKLESMLPVIQTIIGSGNNAKASDLFSAQYKLANLKRVCDDCIEQFDFVLTPTTPTIFSRTEIDEKPIERNSILGTYTNFMNLLDYSATAVPIGQTSSGVYWGVTLFSHAFSDIKLLNTASELHASCSLPLGATKHIQNTEPKVAPAQPNEYVDVVVCGAHLEGQPLNWQLRERGAIKRSLTTSSAHYKLYALSDGKRPGMKRVESGGAKIEIEVWRMPIVHFGSFVTDIPAPLGIGKVELDNGDWLSGFICDDYGLSGANDITEYTSWRNWLRAD